MKIGWNFARFSNGIFIPLNNKPKPIQCLGTFVCRNGEIDACGLDGGMAEHVGESDDISVFLIKTDGEEMAQIVRKYFFSSDAGLLTEAFHLGPDLVSCAGFSTHGAKNGAVGDFLFVDIVLQFMAEFCRQENDALFSFEGYCCASFVDGICGNVAELADADACGADGFHDEGKILFAIGMGCADQSTIV